MKDSFSKISGAVFYPIWDFWDRSRKLKTLRELTESQWSSSETLRSRQWQKFKEILQYSYECCPYYRKSLDEAGAQPDKIRTPQDAQRLPTLSKDDIRNNIHSMISCQYERHDLILAKTGGSTGKSLNVFFDKSCQETRNAAALRSMMWAGWNLGERRAAIWGNPPVLDTPKKRIRNALLDRLVFLDTMDLTEARMSDFARLCERLQPSLFYGHSRSLFIFARFLLASQFVNLRPKGIISTSMMLLPHERATITKAFHCEVTNQYGCEEVGLIACECETHEGLHLNVDHLYIEFIRSDGSPAVPGEESEIVVTDLINKGMPLIRYRIEDIASPATRTCSCGRGLPLMEKVTGRTADFLVRTDGGLVAGVSLVERTLTKIRGIEQMQIVQDDIHRITVRVVRDGAYDRKSEEELLDEFRSVFGPLVQIEVHYLERLPQSPSGKYRFAECRVRSTKLSL